MTSNLFPIILLGFGVFGVVCWDEYQTYKLCKLMGWKYNFFRWED